ncbi:MAG: hypothetical protein WCK77_23710 [Verrucomicrobiota bacterium]
MNLKQQQFVRALLTLTGAEIWQNVHDRVRRVVSAAELRFESGRLCLSVEGCAQLALAIIEGRTQGNAAIAYAVLDRCNRLDHGPSAPQIRVTAKGVRRICQAVIDGNGDVAEARKCLDRLNRTFPEK